MQEVILRIAAVQTFVSAGQEPDRAVSSLY